MQKAGIVNYHLLDGDAPDPDDVVRRVGKQLASSPIDVAFLGIGENGHIAFNDPPADFETEDPYIIVELDEACRRQQVGEGHFQDADSVPRTAITITCPGLFRADAWICCVPELRKAAAVRDALTGPISTFCPASLVRRHPAAWVFLDKDSASLLE